MCLRATEIKPGFAEAHNTLGTAREKLARTDEAMASFRRALLQNVPCRGARQSRECIGSSRAAR